MGYPFCFLINALQDMKNDGILTVPIRDEHFSFLKAHEASPLKSPSSPQLSPKTTANADLNRTMVMPTASGKADISSSSIQLQEKITASHSMPQSVFSSKREHWEDLRRRVLNNESLKMHVRPGKSLVFGVGHLDAKIFFCGEAPGADEEIQGIPFVGRAGQLLTKIIAAMGLSREEVYIGNIMNWRPETETLTGNRPPTQEEMQFCLPYLIEQVEIVQPKVIVALGATAVSGLLGYDRNRKIGAIRGQWHAFYGIPLMVTFHPSYLLRNNTNATKRAVWEDMLKVMEKVDMVISEKQRKYFSKI
ncbi:MAG: uracil-DNA glycosylase [Puniceicoccales bacterium]|jgi:DNA polymerase|nr:uracil-DNA glycosylase [Puniceicoccales bacterium]